MVKQQQEGTNEKALKFIKVLSKLYSLASSYSQEGKVSYIADLERSKFCRLSALLLLLLVLWQKLIYHGPNQMATTQFLLQNNLLILVFITRTTIIRRIHIKAKQTCLCSCRLPKQINGINGINERFSVCGFLLQNMITSFLSHKKARQKEE